MLVKEILVVLLFQMTNDNYKLESPLGATVALGPVILVFLQKLATYVIGSRKSVAFEMILGGFSAYEVRAGIGIENRDSSCIQNKT